MIKLALIGKDIQHSKSNEVYEDLLGEEVKYDLLDCESKDKIPPILKLLQKYKGISVTSPYKTYLYEMIDLEDNPTGLKMINTLTLRDDKIVGFNSDYLALKNIIGNLKIETSTKFHILGDGNMSLTVQKIVESGNCHVYSRKQGNLNTVSDKMNARDIIINTCSRSYDVDLVLPPSIQFLDLNYDMEYEARLKQSSINYISGHIMLKKQAEYAISFWNLK